MSWKSDDVVTDRTAMFAVYGSMTAQPGRRDTVVELICKAARVGADAGGLISYTVNATLEEPDTMWVTQLWTDKAAHDTTTRSEPVRKVTQQMLALLAQSPTGSYGHVLHCSDEAPGS